MRQKLGTKKVEKLKRQTGLNIIGVLVRGNTGHRKDLCLNDGSVICLMPDGLMFKSKAGHTLTEDKK